MLFAAHLTTLLRNLVLNCMIRFGMTDFTDAVRKKFNLHCSGDDIIPANQRSFVYQTIIASDGKKGFDELMKVRTTMSDDNRVFKRRASI